MKHCSLTEVIQLPQYVNLALAFDGADRECVRERELNKFIIVNCNVCS